MEEKEESCACEQKHRFRRKGVPAKLKTQILIGELPCENEEYVLDIDGVLSRGKTDAEGNIEITIPPNAKRGRIIICDEEFELTLGTIDPIEEKQGVIQVRTVRMVRKKILTSKQLNVFRNRLVWNPQVKMISKLLTLLLKRTEAKHWPAKYVFLSYFILN
jgi:hypothetical protein